MYLAVVIKQLVKLEREMESQEKKVLHYKEQDQEKMKQYQQKIKNIPKEKIAYIDESSINSCLYREYGYAPIGEKIYGKILGRKFQRSNLIAAKLGDQILAPMQYSGTTDSMLFEHWFEEYFLPCLPKDAVIVMDNAAFHRKKQLFEIVEKYNKTLLFLPPYSPELNRIEKFWSILKRWLKKNICFFDSLDNAISAFFNKDLLFPVLK